METEQKTQTGMGEFDTNALIDRHNMIYKEIEECRTSYELRYLIAYEAAIRNIDVQNALSSCILEKDCIEVKSAFGFSDEAIFYYHITHKNIFPIDFKNEVSHGLSSLNNMKPEYKRQKYTIVPLCDKESIVVNDVALIKENNSVSLAHIDKYAAFKKLALEANFKRPKLLPIKKKDFYVQLNFELPESEIIEYVSELYRIYHKEDIKGTIELLSDSFDFSNSKQKKENSRKFADMLYVYDCTIKYRDAFHTENKLHEKISSDLRYADMNDNASPLSFNTIRNYHMRMTYLVEEFGYLELLTGIEQ